MNTTNQANVMPMMLPMQGGMMTGMNNISAKVPAIT